VFAAKLSQARNLSDLMAGAKPTFAGLLDAHDAIAAIAASRLPNAFDGWLSALSTLDATRTHSMRYAPKLVLTDLEIAQVLVGFLALNVGIHTAINVHRENIRALAQITGALKQFNNVSDIQLVLAGPSSDYLTFEAPYSVIEVNVNSYWESGHLGEGISVIMLSTENHAAVQLAAAQFEALRTNPNLQVRALANSRQFFTQLIDDLYSVGLPTELNKPKLVAAQCVSSASHDCLAMLYVEGLIPNNPCIEAVRCRLPAPTTILIWNHLTGQAAVGLYSFRYP